jgi:hypothetical protein
MAETLKIAIIQGIPTISDRNDVIDHCGLCDPAYFPAFPAGRLYLQVFCSGFPPFLTAVEIISVSRIPAPDSAALSLILPSMLRALTTAA